MLDRISAAGPASGPSLPEAGASLAAGGSAALNGGSTDANGRSGSLPAKRSKSNNGDDKEEYTARVRHKASLRVKQRKAMASFLHMATVA